MHGRGHTGTRHRAPSRKSGADQEVPAGLRLLGTLPLPIWRRIVVFSLFFCPVSPPPGGSWALSRLRTPHAVVRANNNARPLLAHSIKALRAYLSPGNLSTVTLISNLSQPPPASLRPVPSHRGLLAPVALALATRPVTRLPLAPRGSHPCVERCRVLAAQQTVTQLLQLPPGTGENRNP